MWRPNKGSQRSWEQAARGSEEARSLGAHIAVSRRDNHAQRMRMLGGVNDEAVHLAKYRAKGYGACAFTQNCCALNKLGGCSVLGAVCSPSIRAYRLTLGSAAVASRGLRVRVSHSEIRTCPPATRQSNLSVIHTVTGV